MDYKTYKDYEGYNGYERYERYDVAWNVNTAIAQQQLPSEVWIASQTCVNKNITQRLSKQTNTGTRPEVGIHSKVAIRLEGAGRPEAATCTRNTAKIRQRS